MPAIKSTDVMRCEECEQDSLLLMEEAWVCVNCARTWENVNGKPHGSGEAIGDARGLTMTAIWNR